MITLIFYSKYTLVKYLYRWDFDTDLKLALDDSIHILLSIDEISYQKKVIDTILKIFTIIQIVMLEMWHNDSLLYSLPYLDKSDVYNVVNKGNINSLCELREKTENDEDLRTIYVN